MLKSLACSCSSSLSSTGSTLSMEMVTGDVRSGVSDDDDIRSTLDSLIVTGDEPGKEVHGQIENTYCTNVSSDLRSIQ